MNLAIAAAALRPTDAQINQWLRGNYGDKDVPALLQGGMFSISKGSRRIVRTRRKSSGKLGFEVEYAGGREVNLARYADKLFPAPKEGDNYNDEIDAVHPEIEDAGRPGTASRIEAYRAWYAERGEVSPNEGLLDEDMEADNFIINVLSREPGEKENTHRELRNWLFAMASDVHREALNNA